MITRSGEEARVKEEKDLEAWLWDGVRSYNSLDEAVVQSHSPKKKKSVSRRLAEDGDEGP